MVRPKGWGLHTQLVLLVIGVVTVAITLISSYFIVQQQHSLQATAAEEADAARYALTKRGVTLVRNVTVSSTMESHDVRPADVLQALHRAVRDIGRQQYYMTCVVAILDPANGHVEFGNAGHPMPVISRAHDPEPDFLVARGNPLGVLPQRSGSGRSEIEAGDLLVLMTDGLDEAQDPSGRPFGTRRIRDTLIRHRAQPGTNGLDLRNSLLNAVRDHAGDRPAADDITVVVCPPMHATG